MKYFITLILFSFNLHAAEIHKDFDLFLKALGKVESNNNDKAYNPPEFAIGRYQVRRLYFEDAKQFDSTLKTNKHIDCFNFIIAKKTVIAYFSKYEPKALKNGDWETLAKCHNGGLNHRRKTGDARKNLEIYWGKVSKELKKELDKKK